MDQWKGVLRRYQQELRTGLIVDNFLPALRPLLTDVEYSRVVDRTGNIEKVDALIAILLTKDYKLFDELCRALEENGYSCWVEKLTKSMDAYQGKPDAWAQSWRSSVCARSLGAINVIVTFSSSWLQILGEVGVYTLYVQTFAVRYFREFRESVEVSEIKFAKLLTISQGNMHVRKALNG